MKKKVLSASVTPLLADGSLDVTGLECIFERNIRHGIDGIFVLGSMGEWGSFSSEFKYDLVEKSTRIINGRIELLVGINATSLNLSLQNMRDYKRFHFDSYVFMLPARTSDLDPVKSILKILDEADRSVYYYHCPPNNGIELNLQQFAEIMAHPNLRGIKNSSSNMWLRRELLLLKQDRGFHTLLFEGQEWAADEALIVGCDGMVCGMGAVASKVMVKIARAVEKHRFQEAVRLQNIFIRIFHGIYGIDVDTICNGEKYALYKMGLIATPLTFAEEMDHLSSQVKKRIEKTLIEFRKELD